MSLPVKIAATIIIAASPLISYEEIEDKAKLPVLTPSLKERKKAKIRLGNNLEALIISDPETNKSGAVLTVLAGSWSDPKEHMGMAHFLEHMLFMGTEKYPNESEYQSYIKESGGEANAFTASSSTSYMFSIDPAHLSGALDRFSEFFKSPLLSTSQVDRELKAIDQEYAKNIENDDIREVFVHRELSNPQHPIHKFSMGNSSTLSDVSQKELREWYENHYSSNLMRLVVIGKEPVEELKKMVEDSFKDIENRNLAPYIPNEALSLDKYRGKLIAIEPVKDVRSLTLVFELPKEAALMKETKPHLIVSHILGHEGEGSLLSLLKDEGLATGITTGELTSSGKNLEIVVEISLTEKGVREWEKAITATFQAIHLLRSTPIPQYVFDDIQTVQKNEYQFQTRQDVFSDLMKKGLYLADESIDTFPERTEIIGRFDPTAVASVARGLNLGNAYIYLRAKPPLQQYTLDKEETWLGARYGIHDLPESLSKAVENIKNDDRLFLPKMNSFIPKKFDKKPYEEAFAKRSLLPIPGIILESERAKIYFAQDNTFLEPKASISMLARSPNIDPKDTRSQVLTDLYLKAVNDALTPLVYPAKIAGLDFMIKRDDLGLMLYVNGYSDTIDVLFESIMERIGSKKYPEERFSQYKESLLREWGNSSVATPLDKSIQLLKASLFKYYPLPEEKIKVLQEIDQAEFNAFIDSLYSAGFVEGILAGNLSSEEAKKIALSAEKTFAKTPYKPPFFQREVLNLKNVLGPLYLEQSINAQGNAALLIIESEAAYSHKERAIHQILTQAIQEPFFSELRTKQQTGYIVQAFGEEIERRLFNFFLAQSTTHSPRDLLARFELFLESYIQELSSQELTEERFNKIKDALVYELKNPVKNLSQATELLAHLLYLYGGDFHWVEKRLKALESLSYAECIEGIRAMLSKENPKRFALLLKGKSNGSPLFDYKPVESLEAFKGEEEYSAPDERDVKGPALKQ